LDKQVTQLRTKYVPIATHVRHDWAHTRTHGLEKTHRGTLGVRGEREERQGRVEKTQICAPPHELYVGAEVQFAYQRGQEITVWAFANQHQERSRLGFQFLAKEGERPYQDVVALDRGKAADAADYGPKGIDTEHGVHAACRVPWRIHLCVDSVVDDADTVRVPGRYAGQVIGERVGDCYDGCCEG
jgi:hypothetical protein